MAWPLKTNTLESILSEDSAPATTSTPPQTIVAKVKPSRIPVRKQVSNQATKLIRTTKNISLSEIQNEVHLSNPAFNKFLAFIIYRLLDSHSLTRHKPKSLLAQTIFNKIVTEAMAVHMRERPAGTPALPRSNMVNFVNKLKALLGKDKDKQNKRDANRQMGTMVGGGSTRNFAIPPNAPSGTTGFPYPHTLFVTKALEALLNQCVVSMDIFSADRGSMPPLELTADRFLRTGANPELHASYSFEKFAELYEDKLNKDERYEKIDIRNGTIIYFPRGEPKRVVDQDSFEVALAKLYVERERTISMHFVFQPEKDEEKLLRLISEVHQMRYGTVGSRPKSMSEAMARASKEIDDDTKIDMIFEGPEEEERQQRERAMKRKGKEPVRDECWTTPKAGESASFVNPERPLQFSTPSSTQKSPASFSTPVTTFLGESPFTPESMYTTPGQALATFEDVLRDEEQAEASSSTPSKIKKPASFTNKVFQRGQTVEARDNEWKKLFEIKERMAYKTGGDDEPEIGIHVAGEEEISAEEKELDLVEDEDDDSEKMVSAGDQVVEKLQSLQNLPELTQIEDPDHLGEHRRWKECCKMFNLEPSKTDLEELVVVAGLKTKIYQYQAFGVYWQMTTSRKLGGGFVADTMGLGKTLSFLALFVVERQLSCLWRAVDESRKAKDGKHLQEDQHHKGDSCPSRAVPGWISCPCASSNPTSAMRPKPGVRLACVPDNLVRNWWSEWKRHVDTSDQTILGLTIVINYKGAFDLKTTGADLLADSNTGRNKTRLTAKTITPGQERAEAHQSGWLVITAVASYKDWIKKFEYRAQAKDQDGKSKTTTRSQIVFGIAMIDESHEEYFKQTGRGKILHDLPSTNQPFIWGYSGTPFSQTPRGLEGVLWAMEQHAKKSDNEWSKNPVLKQLDYRALDKICKEFDKEFQNETPDHDKVDVILESFKPFLLNFVIRRTAETLWFGHRIIKLKPHYHQDMVLAAANNSRAAHFQRLVVSHESQFQSEKDQRLLELQQKWDDFPEKRMAPNRPTALRFNTMCRLQWRLRVLASFPYLVKLLYPSDPASKLDLSAGEALGFVRPGEKIKDNPYFAHIRNIVEDSPKLLWLHSLIQTLYPPREQDDRSEPQKLVIITSFPQVAFILKMFMLKYFPEKERNEEVGLILPRMKTKDRAAILESFTDVLDVNGKRKHKKNIEVLIGTTRLIGTGLQLTRAANIVLMEPDYEFVNEIQIYGRIHRIGQKHDCSFSYRLINSESEVEKAIVGRQRDRKEVFGRKLVEEEFKDLIEPVDPKGEF